MRRLTFLFLLAGLSLGRGQQPAATAAPADGSATNATAVEDAPIDPAKEAEIRKLIENTGVKENMKLVMGRMFETYRKKYPEVPADFWTQMDSDANLDDLISRLVPVYARYYTIDDIKAINGFYNSPTGQHMKEMQPQIVGASMLVGQQWGREIGARIMSGVMAQQAKTYANEDKNTYYTAVSTNAAPAATSATNAPAAAH
jgi:hypothetical protein